MNIHDSGNDFSGLSMGHTQTFDELFRAYYSPLCYFATNFLESEDDAKDLIEDLFLKLWQRQQAFENHQHAQGFLYRSARNACLNFLKQGQKTAVKHGILMAEPDAIEEDYLMQMIRSEVWGEIYRAIEKLPLQCHKVITMSFIDGHTNEEIARALDLSVQTVKNHKVRGLRILKDTLPGSLLVLLILHSFSKL